MLFQDISPEIFNFLKEINIFGEGGIMGNW